MESPLYAIRGLTHVYRGKPVLSIDRLDLPRGGIIGVIGPNGSGKSTFLRLAGFVERPTAGEVLFDGKPAGPFAPEVRNRVTLLPQEPFLMKRTVLNNVAYGLRIRKANDHLADRVDKALSYVGLDGKDFAQRPSYALSGGEAQRVALAARLILKPEVLLMDEPTASIDALSAQLIKDAVLKARRDWGTTLIVASHDWQWLYGICDTVFHLLKGRFLGTGRENVLFGPVGACRERAVGKAARRRPAVAGAQAAGGPCGGCYRKCHYYATGRACLWRGGAGHIVRPDHPPGPGEGIGVHRGFRAGRQSPVHGDAHRTSGQGSCALSRPNGRHPL